MRNYYGIRPFFLKGFVAQYMIIVPVCIDDVFDGKGTKLFYFLYFFFGIAGIGAGINNNKSRRGYNKNRIPVNIILKRI